MDENKALEPTTSLALIDDPIIQDLAKDLDDNIITNLKLTEKEIVKLKKYAIMIRYGDYNVLPMMCVGERCICRLRCPLLDMGKVALGKECPFERYALMQWQADYIKALAIDIDNKVERQQVMEIVEADILNARANVVLSDEGFIMENPIGINENTGDAITRREEHVALKLKDRAQNRKDKIWKSFLTTREQKLKVALQKDPTEILAELREKARRLDEKHEKTIGAQEVIDATTATTIDVKKEVPDGAF